MLIDPNHFLFFFVQVFAEHPGPAGRCRDGDAAVQRRGGQVKPVS